MTNIKAVHIYKKNIIRTVIILLLILHINTIQANDLTVDVNISVNNDNIIRNVSKLLMGMNMSYHRNTDERWKDGRIAARLSEIKTSILRFPGGGETNTYHWKECPGIPGWKATRKDIWETDTTSKYYLKDKSICKNTEYMDIDEFLYWCNVIGAEPLIGINYSSGWRYNRLDDSIEEAVEWMKYCKEKGYDVKYWYIGNETYEGFISADDYADVLNKFSKAMREVDTNIMIIANGRCRMYDPHVWNRWETIINLAGDNFDIGDIHWQWARLTSSWEKYINQNPLLNEFHAYVGSTYTKEAEIWHKRINELDQDIKLAVMEWNAGPPAVKEVDLKYKEVQDFKDKLTWQDKSLSAFQCALVQSEMFMQFMEGGVYLACLYPSTFHILKGRNYNRTLLDPYTLEPRPGFYALKLFSNSLGHNLVESKSNSIRIPSSTVLSNDGRNGWIYLLNKMGEPKFTCINIKGKEIKRVKAVSLVAVGDVSSNEANMKDQGITFSKNSVNLTLPSYSLTMITVNY